MIGKLADSGAAAGQNNVAFMSHYILGEVGACLDLLVATGRLPEAACFARTHLPGRLQEVVAKWRESVAQVSEKASKSLADPEGYPNLFPNFDASAKKEAEAPSAAEQEEDEEEGAAAAEEDEVDVLEKEIGDLKVVGKQK